VSDLPSSFTGAELRQTFAQFGNITFCEMDTPENNSPNGNSTGGAQSNSGRIAFDSAMSAMRAVNMMDGLSVGDKLLHVVALIH
jgi:hypothetical protein